jgi:sarcosine oxidase subunit beta
MGVSAAHFLSKAGIRDILLLDENPPLSLTSDHSTECYRNWWPDPNMLALMNRSIDLMEQLADESGNIFRMNRRGYLYVTADESRLVDFQKRAARTGRLGAGPLRIHTEADCTYQPVAEHDFHDQPEGADLLLGPELIHKYFPGITKTAVAALHVRRAGWMSAQQLGMYLLEQARRNGTRFESARVVAAETANGHVKAVTLADGRQVACHIFINAAGPFLNVTAGFLGIELPVYTELHLKAAFNDHLGVVPRDAPLLIWDDAQTLPWEAGERQILSEDPQLNWLVGTFPAGAHLRPEGGTESKTVLMLWEYKPRLIEATFPLPLDERYPEIALRGMSTMLPGLSRYFSKMPRPQLDGGYYTRTPENRLLAGPLPLEGAYLIGAASGYGIMSACAAGELLAAHITSAPLPAYAPAFSLGRYEDPRYMDRMQGLAENGQL